MKIMTIFILSLAILLLWFIAHILYKPVYDKVTQNYVIDNSEIQLANVCIFIMVILGLVIGLLL